MVSLRGTEAPSTGPAGDVSPAELRRRYAAYRYRQAARLVHLMPREAVRPLYRKAWAAAAASGFPSDEEGGDDPLATLVRYCEGLLPLPPFDVWLADLKGHPDEHFADVDDSADAPTADAPATMMVRSFRYGGRPWQASLRSFRDGGVWRGFIAFQEEPEGPEHRTAAVFRELEPGALRERFLSFDRPALKAFLRSSLP